MRSRLLQILTAVAVVAPVAALAQPASAGPAGVPVPSGAPSVGQYQAGRGGVGAKVPFTEYQAEQASTNGTRIGPDWAYGTLAAEAVGRRAVRLDARGQYVEFRLTKAANAVDVRYSIPDSANGEGLDATLGVYINGHRARSLPVTSRYSWYYGIYPWSNNPADGGRRDLYDDSRIMLGSTLPAGTRVKLQVGAVDTAPWYVIDSADFEKVAPPAARPPRSLSVVHYGADPTGLRDSTQAIQRALTAASGTGKTVWLPVGTFTVSRHLIVDKVRLRGAGPWYSVLHGDGVGVYGNYNPTPSSDVHLSDFAIFGEVTNRIDAAQVNAIGGALNHSTVDDVWLQHTKVGLWLDGPFDGLKISRVRILDQTADGINFHDGVTNSSVTNSFIRQTGDDGLAMWSEHHPDSANVFAHNTVQIPTLANNIAIYGGQNNTVTANLATDTLTQGGGIQVANRFGAVPLAGTTAITRNVLLRTGTLDLFSHIGNGALLFWAADEPMTGTVKVSRNLIYDSAYEAVQFLGSTVTNVHLDYNLIVKTGTFAVQLNAAGSATFSHVVGLGLRAGGRYDCNSGFTITERRGDYGWSDSHCGYPPPGPLTLNAQNLNFVSEGNSVSDPQTVTITNPTGAPQRIASITATGTYLVSTTCGHVLAPHSSCTVDIRFAPTAQGDRSAALTVSDGTPAGRYQVYLAGTVIVHQPGNLADGRPVTASSQNDCCRATNAVDSNTNTYWESLSPLPQSLTVDLGTNTAVGRVTLRLNPGWGGRIQNVTVLGSTDGITFTTLAPAADYTFDPNTNLNTVNIAFTATPQRFVRVQINRNNGAPGGQVAEFEVYAR